MDEQYESLEKARVLIMELLSEIKPLFEDDNVTEIFGQPNGEVWVIHRKTGITRTRMYLSDAARTGVINTIASLHNTVLDEDNPSVSKSMPITGERFQGTIPPASPDGPSFTIRKHAARALSFEDMVRNQTLSQAHVLILKTAIQDRKNIIVAGGTNSGKTTLCNTLLQYMAALRPVGRIISVEDTLELQNLAHCHLKMKVNLQTKYNYKRALEDILRSSPDRIVIGELRTGEATLAVLDSWNTGHPGGLSTIHASSAMMTLIRIEELLRQLRDYVSKALIAATVNVIVYIQKQEDLTRKVTEIIEIDEQLVNGQYHIKSHKRGC